MPTAFLQPDSRLLRDCEESIVLTSNERLRRELVRAYDAHQQQSGRSAWPSASVFSFASYLAHQYHLLAGQRPQLPRLLSSEAELVLFQRFAPEHGGRLSRTALQAWNLTHAWAVPLTDAAFAGTDDGRVFLAWAGRVREHLHATVCVTRAELPGLLGAHLQDQPAGDTSESRQLVCLGFESVTRAAQGYFSGLEAAGWGVEFRQPQDTKPARVARTECASSTAELGAMAQWCRNVLEVQPDARVGVVIPDLTNRHHQIRRQFGAQLEAFAHAGAPTTFDVAAGLPLTQQPIWRAAQRLLELCVGSLPTNDAAALLGSRYLALRSTLAPSPDLPSELTLWRLADITGDPLLDALNRLCPRADAIASFSAWIRLFAALLSTAGWTGSGAQSAQYQAWEQLQASIDQTGSGLAADFSCTAPHALSLLRQILDARVFAPRSAAAPVQIMGYLETTGLRFTHLWISGMQDTAWPAPVAPSPFIPLPTQRHYQIPRIDQRGELAFATTRLAHWLGASDQVIFSHVIDDGEVQHLPSPLTAETPATPIVSLVAGWRPRSHPLFAPTADALEPFDDEYGSLVDASGHGGGAGLLRDQAACPFRAWAIHRLGLRDTRAPHAFPDALDRGNLVHEALHRLLAPTADHESAPRHPRELANADVVAAADAALARLYGRFPAPFIDRESLRLAALLGRWLQLEASRPEFQVLSVESDAELRIAGLTLRLRLDRVDQVGDRLLVIDYKTGAIRPGGLVAPRLLEPQLPAYAVTVTGTGVDVGAVLFAKLDGSRPRLAGLAEAGMDLGPVGLEPLPYPSWTQLQARWRDQLQELGDEFRAGRAAVAPAEPDTCRHCHLQALCRINADGHNQ